MSENDEPRRAADGAPNHSDENRLGGGDEPPDKADKIRDLLFGPQMRDYEQRFARLEDRMQKELTDLREDTRQRLAVMGELMKRESETLAEAQNALKTELGEASRKLAGELGESTRGWEAADARSGERNSAAQRDLRQLVLEESKRLGEEIEKRHADLVANQGQETRELRARLTSRAALADIFSEAATRLKDESKLP